MLAHANLRINFGWLEYLLVTPRYHHWHHARELDYVDVNYAIHLPLIDMLMGTFKRPGRRRLAAGIRRNEIADSTGRLRPANLHAVQTEAGISGLRRARKRMIVHLKAAARPVLADARRSAENVGLFITYQSRQAPAR